ncbi:hypothetical protein QR680_009376 [Steinernema hermaphroditum]|uniref:Mothers against decapentaplegic homolog n=1 Tax=Steinernema hermaphroditum TaxID=289476 RepID=A0AA39IM39_9BILA|nr:hypothetical protein QR680_009376 [Steinernema hermaphroditum]
MSEESSNSIIRKLWGLSRKPPPPKQEEFKGWFQKAVAPMVKVFKKEPDALRRLEKVVVDEDENSACIYVKRMVPGEKGRVSLPFVYTKLFRFPIISTQWDINQRRICRANTQLGFVCVNPYHYNLRGPKPAIPAIVVKKGQFAEACAQDLSNMSLSMSDINTCRNMVETDDIVREGVPNKYLTMEQIEDMNDRLIRVKRSRNEVYTKKYSSRDYCFDNENETILVTECEDSDLSDLVEFVAEAVEYHDPSIWSTLTYFEEGTRLGEQFYATSESIVVDGFTAPSSNGRFSIGCIPNSRRTQESVNARNLIGRGIRITHITGEVFLENLSGNPVFIQSPWMNNINKWHIATVIKVPGHCMLKIFNTREFASVLAEAVTRNYEAAYALTRMCAIRISFTKAGPTRAPVQ